MDGAKDVTATFALLPTYQLEVTTARDGRDGRLGASGDRLWVGLHGGVRARDTGPAHGACGAWLELRWLGRGVRWDGADVPGDDERASERDASFSRILAAEPIRWRRRVAVSATGGTLTRPAGVGWQAGAVVGAGAHLRGRVRGVHGDDAGRVPDVRAEPR